MRTIRLISIHSFLLVLIPASPLAYEVDNHSIMTTLAVENSIFYRAGAENAELLFSLGMAPSIHYQYYKETLFGTMDQSPEELARQSVLELIKNGAMEEDELFPWYWSQASKEHWDNRCNTLPYGLLPRVNNHFFDPLKGIDDPSAGLTPGTISLGAPSLHWALQQSPNDHHENQFYSYRLFKNYLFDALTAKEGYEEKYAFTFEALGHIVHHIQDMAQPAHVRNDSHCPAAFCMPLQVILEACEDYSFDQDLYNAGGGSEFESYASKIYGDRVIPSGDYSPRIFARPERFWTYGGYGLADFTNRHFVSPDTNFVGIMEEFSTHPNYPNPSDQDAQVSAFEDVVMLYPDNVSLTGNMAFVRTPVQDMYLGESAYYPHRTSTYSLFSKDILWTHSYWSGRPVPVQESIKRSTFTLNRLNYETAYEVLMPKAVAYSAGFINYAFRGKLDIALPSQGVYAVTDQARGIPFTKLTTRVRNSTEDIDSPADGLVPQDATGGFLWAVVSFRPNPCYESDLSGELHEGDDSPEACDISTWADTTLHRAVSSIYLSDGIPSEGWREVEFDFSNDPIPLSARDVQLRLVYKGTLGLEEDGLAIGHQRLSAPSWLTYINSTDIININGMNVFSDTFLADEDWKEEWEIEPEQEAALAKQQVYDIRTGFGGSQLAGPAGTYVYGSTRLAVLTDVLPGALNVDVDAWMVNAGPTEVLASGLNGLSSHVGWKGVYVDGRHWEYKPVFCMEEHGCFVSELAKQRGISSFNTVYFMHQLGMQPADLDDLSSIPMPYIEAPSPTPVLGN